MSQWFATQALEEVTQKWRRLAESRRAHFVELHRSGRWKHYFTEEQFLRRMREAIHASERWAEIAPASEEALAQEHPSGLPNRTAA